MAMTKTVEAQREELVRAARLLGENLSRRSFGEREPNLNVTLADLEQFLRALVKAMAGGFLAVSANQRAGAAVGGGIALSHLRAGVLAGGTADWKTRRPPLTSPTPSLKSGCR